MPHAQIELIENTDNVCTDTCPHHSALHSAENLGLSKTWLSEVQISALAEQCIVPHK